jgi:hypothetical protein
MQTVHKWKKTEDGDRTASFRPWPAPVLLGPPQEALLEAIAEVLTRFRGYATGAGKADYHPMRLGKRK